MSHPLTLITFIPLIGMVLILLCPKGQEKFIRWIAVAFTFPQLLIAGWLYANFDTTTTSIQFAEHRAWIPAYHIFYFLGVDGISISMVLLTAIICFISVFASFSIDRGERGYYALLLLLDTGMMGVFVALDFFLFYIFWEVMLLPMYFLIGIWGGPRREYAAIKFFLYTLLGSVLILLAMLGLYYYGATPTFDMIELAANAGHYSMTFQRVAWLALFIGFAIKIPAFPFHTWLPDAHVEAPTAISVILAGVLLKMGTYGILRINFSILPAASHEFAFWLLGVIGTINIVYGALCAMAQTDYKKLIAYSSVSHMGYVMLGMAALTTAGINGAVLQMFNHGTITAMLFLLVGVIYDRAHHREIAGFGGLASQMPMYAAHNRLRVFRRNGLAGALRLHLRGAGADRRMAALPGDDDPGRRHRDSDRRLHAMDLPARLPRPAQRKIPGPQRPHAARGFHTDSACDNRARPRRLSACHPRPARRIAQSRKPGRADGARASGRRDGAVSGGRALANRRWTSATSPA